MECGLLPANQFYNRERSIQKFRKFSLLGSKVFFQAGLFSEDGFGPIQNKEKESQIYCPM